jgi:hypothetical protein
MRNGQQKRMRGRNRGGRGHNPLTRVYESNGPDVKIRGTAHHIAEKYVQLARDAQSSGDPVAAEGYLQHAEHYYRLIAAAQAQFGQQNPHQQHQPSQNFRDSDDFDGEGDDAADSNAQPYPGGAPMAQQPPHQPYQQQPYQQRPQHPQPPHQPQYQPQHQQPQQQPPQQPPPHSQPQPNFQGYPQRGGAEQERDVGLPAFITGGQGGQGQTPQSGNGGYDNDQGDRDGGRYGRRRRRFRPRGPSEFAPHTQNPNEMQNAAPQPVNPAPAAPEAQPSEPMPVPGKPAGTE